MIPDEDFLFTYADVLFDVNIEDMFEAHVRDNSVATVLISPCADPDDRPLCVCSKGSNEIISLIPKQGKNDGPRGGIFPNTPKNGLMILNKSVFKGLPADPTYIDMEEDILTKAIYNPAVTSKVTAWNTPCYVKDIGTVDRYYEGVKDLEANIPALKNPAKTQQHCIIYNESDLVSIDDKGNAFLNTQLSESILKANEAGVITILNKDNEKLDVHTRADWVVDSLLARDGDGAFVSARYDSENVEDLVNIFEEWNIPRNNAYALDCLDSKGCILTNLGTENQEVQANIMSATYNVLEKVAVANPVEGGCQ